MKYLLRVKNFQSLRDVTLEIEGVTVLYGPRSNIGKSAVVRVLDAMLFGDCPKDMVTWGEKASVALLQWEGHYIKWAKGEGVNGYEVDGVKYAKVGKSVPEVIPELGFKYLEAQDLKIKAQVRKQFDKAWPLILNATDLGKVVGSLVQTEKVYGAVKELLSDATRVRSKRGQVEVLLGEKEKSLRRLAELDVFGAQLDVITLEGVNKLAFTVETVQRKISEKAQYEQQISRLSAHETDIPSEVLLRDVCRKQELLRKKSELELKIGGLVFKTPLPELGVLNAYPRILRMSAFIEQTLFSFVVEIPTQSSLDVLKRCAELLSGLDVIYNEMFDVDEELLALGEDIRGLGLEACAACEGKGWAVK